MGNGSMAADQGNFGRTRYAEMLIPLLPPRMSGKLLRFESDGSPARASNLKGNERSSHIRRRESQNRTVPDKK